ncbi:hypothetical protein ACLB2K_066280 [Fragaria x ananassa]
MHSSKAPGPDGMSPFFFQKYCDLVGGQVKEVQDMSQLRPIALCNVIYKIASKVSYWIFISPQQSVFVPDCLIFDNTLVASELAHYMHKLRRVQEGFLALKLDISKAYDRLEWSFLQKIMLKMGFDPRWVENCEMIKDLLSLYEKASRQQVNLQKSNVVFSRNVPEATSQELADILGVQLVEKHEKYLGIPTLNLIQELINFVPNFGRGSTDEKKAMHWRAWDSLCKPKALGDRRDRFSIKSAYHVARRKVLEEDETGSAFMDTHLSRQNDNTNLLLLKVGTRDCDLCLLHNPETGESNNLIQSTQTSRLEFDVHGTCNGLICLSSQSRLSSQSHDSHLPYFAIIWIPSIRRFVFLPRPRVVDYENVEQFHAFGFDMPTNDYKVLRIMSYRDRSDVPPNTPYEVEVYLLARGSWKSLSAAVVPKDYNHYLEFRDGLFYVNYDSRQAVRFAIDGSDWCFVDSFVESLVLLSQANAISY